MPSRHVTQQYLMQCWHDPLRTGPLGPAPLNVVVPPEDVERLMRVIAGDRA